MNTYEKLYEKACDMTVIDSHEHLPDESERVAQHVDFYTLFQNYCTEDLIASGMPRSYVNRLTSDMPVEEKWKLFYPYYDKTRDGSYANCARIAMKRFYGMDDLYSFDDALLLTARIREANKPGLYEKVLKDACKIATCMNYNIVLPSGQRYFTPVPFVTHFAQVSSLQEILNIEAASGCMVHDLDSYINAVRTLIERERRNGAKGLKFHFAYYRGIDLDLVEKSRAESIFNRILSEGFGRRIYAIGYNEALPLQDYITCEIVKYAGEFDLPVVFHVGFQAGSYQKLEDTRPEKMWQAALRFRNVRFIMLHAGLPYMREGAVMAKQYPNIFLDLAWTHIMCPQIVTDAVSCYVDLVPRNKVIGFGGDFLVVEKVYGHLMLARHNLAKALAHKVDNGGLRYAQAEKWLEDMLYNNPLEIFKLEIKCQ